LRKIVKGRKIEKGIRKREKDKKDKEERER
jgi:hypothetical protein